jgi:hypothetical protein
LTFHSLSQKLAKKSTTNEFFSWPNLSFCL